MLLLTFALTFFSPDRGVADNLYRLFVALPALVMLSAPIISGLNDIKAVRWFAVLSLYFLLSVSWSGEIESFDNLLLRILSVWGLVLLLYYLSVYRPELFVQIDRVMVGFGLVWLLLIVADWDSLWSARPHFDLTSVSRGVFSHHLQVGWMLAVLSLLSVQRTLRKGSGRLRWSVVTLLFFVTLLFTQARGGLLVFFAGLVACLFVGQRHLDRRLISIVSVGLLCTVGVLYCFYPDMFMSLLKRGASGRFAIWENWYGLWTGGVHKLIFGYGFGASTENVIGNFTAAHFHNFYLNTFFYGGFLGAITFFIWISSVLRSKADCIPWSPVLFGMMVGFLTDGDKLFNYPGAFTLCFILPAFCIVFDNNKGFCK